MSRCTQCTSGFFTSIYWRKDMQPRVPDKINHSLIMNFICPKLSERSKGNLHYQVWRNNDDQSLGIAISKNESSGGFSAELVKVSDILETLNGLRKTGRAFHATALKQLFIGKSANNPCFLAAILVDQKVIHPHPNTQRLLEVSGDAEFWESRLKEASPEKHTAAIVNVESPKVGRVAKPTKEG